MDMYNQMGYGGDMLGYDGNMMYVPTDVSNTMSNNYEDMKLGYNVNYNEYGYPMDYENVGTMPMLYSGFLPQYGYMPMNDMMYGNNMVQYNMMDYQRQPLYYQPVDNMMYDIDNTNYGVNNNMLMTTLVDVKEDDRNSMGNVSTCESTPVFMPITYEPINDGFDLKQQQTYNYMNYDNVYRIDNDATTEEAIIEISNEISRNMQFLPDKDGNGKYSLDKNHPIHCVWRDLNRGHCSWRCRWWYNGKRLSKNFNVKRFGDFEAMRMAITMKIRNSTPVERLQLLKEQREAVRNHLELLKQQNLHDIPEDIIYSLSLESNDKNKNLSDNKKLQRDNWSRISWTYIKTPELQSGDATIICKLCSKTTRCSRSRNLQQAHIMHLIRMHKNPWKQYLHPDGLTKMCKSALDTLYQQFNFKPDHKWHLRPGLKRPEPTFL